MADEPIKQFNGLTPLQAANTPTIDRICALGKCGLLHTVPQG